MREIYTSGSVRGTPSNGRSYRDIVTREQPVTLLASVCINLPALYPSMPILRTLSEEPCFMLISKTQAIV